MLADGTDKSPPRRFVSISIPADHPRQCRPDFADHRLRAASACRRWPGIIKWPLRIIVGAICGVILFGALSLLFAILNP
jgi:hypothetical protein